MVRFVKVMISDDFKLATMEVLPGKLTLSILVGVIGWCDGDGVILSVVLTEIIIFWLYLQVGKSLKVT